MWITLGFYYSSLCSSCFRQWNLPSFCQHGDDYLTAKLYDPLSWCVTDVCGYDNGNVIAEYYDHSFLMVPFERYGKTLSFISYKLWTNILFSTDEAKAYNSYRHTVQHIFESLCWHKNDCRSHYFLSWWSCIIWYIKYIIWYILSASHWRCYLSKNPPLFQPAC